MVDGDGEAAGEAVDHGHVVVEAGLAVEVAEFAHEVQGGVEDGLGGGEVGGVDEGGGVVLGADGHGAAVVEAAGGGDGAFVDGDPGGVVELQVEVGADDGGQLPAVGVPAAGGGEFAGGQEVGAFGVEPGAGLFGGGHGGGGTGVVPSGVTSLGRPVRICMAVAVVWVW
ncbi:hypothetical protein ACFQ9X_25925 [Catenulispora yoronensis]